MRRTLWVTLGLTVLTAWGCNDDDDNPVNVLKFDTVTTELTTGALSVRKTADGGDYYHLVLYLYGPKWDGSSSSRHYLYLWFTSATPDLAEGNHTIISPKELNGPFTAGLALPGQIMRGLSQDVDAGTAQYQTYTILKGSIQINKIGNVYSIQFSGESVSNEGYLPTYISYTGKLSYDVIP
jgi:hypothetical protein